MLLQMLLQYGSDGSRECHRSVPRVGLGLADHPLTTEASDRALDAESPAGQESDAMASSSTATSRMARSSR